MFHRIWLSDPLNPTQIPPKYEANWSAWRRQFPGEEFRTWTNADIDAFPSVSRLVHEAQVMARKADILRYAILHEWGGVYLDCDIEPYHRPDFLLDLMQVVVCNEDEETSYCTNSFIAAPPHAQIFADIIQDLQGKKLNVLPPNQETGPYFFGIHVNRYPSVKRLPSSAFYPYFVYEPRAAIYNRDLMQTYGIHQWGASWLTNDEHSEILSLKASQNESLEIEQALCETKLSASSKIVETSRSLRALREDFVNFVMKHQAGFGGFDAESRKAFELLKVACWAFENRSDLVVWQVGAADGILVDPIRPLMVRFNPVSVLLEPNPWVFKELQKNYAQNDQAVLLNAALTDHDCALEMNCMIPEQIRAKKLPDWTLGISSLYHDKNVLDGRDLTPELHEGILSAMRRETVRGLCVRSIMDEAGIGLPDLLVVDAEGSDANVIKQILGEGATPLIIQFEHSNLGADEQVDLAELLILDYVIYKFGNDTVAYRKNFFSEYCRFIAIEHGIPGIFSSFLRDDRFFSAQQLKVLNPEVSAAENLDVPFDEKIPSTDIEIIKSAREALLANKIFNWARCDDPALCSEILNELESTTDAFDIVKVLARDFYHDQERIAERLIGSWLTPKLPARNRTVGIYYQRLHTGGTERVMASLIQIWTDAGYSVVLFTDEPPHKDDFAISLDILRVVLNDGSVGTKDQVKNRLTALHTQLIKHGIGTFVHNSVYDDGFLFDLLTIKACGIRIVAINHITFITPVPLQSMKLVLATKTFRLLDSLVVLSRDEEIFWCLFDVPAKYIPNPLQWKIHDIKIVPLNTKNVVWVGRFAFEKRVFDALKIFHEVVKSEPASKLFIVGRGETPDVMVAVRNKIDELKLSENVEMVGYTPDIAPYYEKAVVHLITSQTEAFPLTLLESKAHGVPCVLYDLPNLELLRTGEGAIKVKQRDTRAAARAIVGILSNEVYRKDMGRAARVSLEDFMADVDISKAWTDIFSNVGRLTTEGLAEIPSNEAFGKVLDTLLSSIRAGIEWRDENFLTKREVGHHYMTKSDVATHYIPKSQLDPIVRKTTRKGLVGGVARWADSLRKRIKGRPRKAAISWERQLRRHARYSRRLVNILGAYAVVATIALCLR